jgi:hypothetical protein
MSNRPRLTVDLTPKQKEFLDSLPFGWKQQLYSALTDMLIDMTARCGQTTLGAIVSQRIKLENYFFEKGE